MWLQTDFLSYLFFPSSDSVFQSPRGEGDISSGSGLFQVPQRQVSCGSPWSRLTCSEGHSDATADLFLVRLSSGHFLVPRKKSEHSFPALENFSLLSSPKLDSPLVSSVLLVCEGLVRD